MESAEASSLCAHPGEAEGHVDAGSARETPHQDVVFSLVRISQQVQGFPICQSLSMVWQPPLIQEARSHQEKEARIELATHRGHQPWSAKLPSDSVP